jgi:hypothetical protein
VKSFHYEELPMFIKWQVRHYPEVIHPDRLPQYRVEPAEERVDAVLVEAIRVDGKPRQRHVAVLGGFRQRVKQQTWEEYLVDLGHRKADAAKYHFVAWEMTQEEWLARQERGRVQTAAAFYATVDAKLAKLDNVVGPETRVTLLTALAKRIERPAPEAVAKATAEEKVAYEALMGPEESPEERSYRFWKMFRGSSNHWNQAKAREAAAELAALGIDPEAKLAAERAALVTERAAVVDALATDDFYVTRPWLHDIVPDEEREAILRYERGLFVAGQEAAQADPDLAAMLGNG